MIPYGRQLIDEDDIDAVVEVLRSDWLTTGPKVSEFEQAMANYVGSKFAIAVSSGTAALHCAMYALEIGCGDEVIVPCMTFAATANCLVFQGAKPIFTDVDPNTLLIDPVQVEKNITKKTRAIIAVDYAGQPCEYDELKTIAERNGVKLVADGCHALGAEYKGRRVGSLADMTVFSFHPVKHITTGEGGMITTDDKKIAEKMRIFRNHGIGADHHHRSRKRTWYYEMIDLGFNYRLTDIQCALGISQLKKLPDFLARRREIASVYDRTFKNMPGINPLRTREDVIHAYHLYVARVKNEKAGIGRKAVFQKLREGGIGVNVHYIPVHLHPYYQRKFGTGPELCPVAEKAYEEIISLPVFPGMTDRDVKNVTQSVKKVMLEQSLNSRKD